MLGVVMWVGEHARFDINKCGLGNAGGFGYWVWVEIWNRGVFWGCVYLMD